MKATVQPARAETVALTAEKITSARAQSAAWIFARRHGVRSASSRSLGEGGRSASIHARSSAASRTPSHQPTAIATGM